MKNFERQASLEKKNGMTGNEPYCKFCTKQMPQGAEEHYGSRCFGKGTEKIALGVPCSTAYNRMVRDIKADMVEE